MRVPTEAEVLEMNQKRNYWDSWHRVARICHKYRIIARTARLTLDCSSGTRTVQIELFDDRGSVPLPDLTRAETFYLNAMPVQDILWLDLTTKPEFQEPTLFV